MASIIYLSFDYAAKRIRLKLEVTTVEQLKGFREVICIGKEEERECGRVLELTASVFVKEATGSVSHVWTNGVRKKCTHHFLCGIFICC